MSLHGICSLELRQVIEQAFLPSHCVVSCLDDGSLTIHLEQDSYGPALTVAGIRADELSSSRALADLVAHVQAERQHPTTQVEVPPLRP
ncbi:hypothetical protein GCM10009504_06460 [Pseudomonas laurentiana]|uniref:DUF1652 domain-containing protein n=1 Tax=Pseudomonas laurentiana TaxID=2364649 RepID=A0A6I5RUN4_9PSED|nr:DUF1652 domain-containing protein [Pseudomonas laurentiana]NES11787.1 DUF1652 domain-containing protein [Pseudomonas laurentiana]GGU52366.1 hypothetical protein GCM10009504_06460 [Pseudomonas laurentiana]